MSLSESKRIDQAIKSFLPERVCSNLSIKAKYIDAVVFCADISGFTSMSEKLSLMGKEGSEEITKVINFFFEPLVEIIIKRRGDIFFFGGDAITAVFEKRDAYSAILAAYEAKEYVRIHSQAKTSKGIFEIGIHIAINYGRVYFQDTGKSFILAGDVCFRVVEMLDSASAGEIVISREFKNLVPEAKCEKISSSMFKFEKLKEMRRVKNKTADNHDLKKNTEPYLQPWLISRIRQKKSFDQKDGEHRRAAVMFIHFGKIPFDSDKKRSQMIVTNITESLKRISEKYKGWINKIDFYKDGLRALVIFGYPVKLDNDDKHAVLFAQELIKDEKLKEVSVSIGINSGFIFSTPVGSSKRMELTVMGDAVNTAARIGAKAKKNRVTVSESVYEKTKDSLSFKKTASKKMKGKKKRVRMFELSSSNAKREQNNVSEWMSESRHLIGNKDLLADFENQIKKALEGESIVFAIEGHAGLGKSRIVRELEKNLEKNKCRVYKGNCLSYGSSLSYHPWIEILNSIFGITSHDAMESRKKKIASMLLRMNKSMKDWLPLIGEIMSVKFEMNDLVRNLDNSLKMQKFYDIVLELLVFISRESFLSIVIEDYHWSDNSSSELLNYICRNTKKERIMFLIPYRPISDKAGIKEIEASVKHKLKELSEEETGELIENLLDVENIDKEMKNLIMKKSQGNPFYVEELVKSFIEQNYIAKEKGGWSLNRKAEEIALPNSVEEVILSRIDRLDLKEREILQSASVLGREFDMNLLSSLCSDKKLLVSSMNVLKQLDLIKTDEENEKKFFFKHILTCETAYNTLSFAKKRETHEKAGRLLEKKEKDRALNLGMLSYHFHKAHNREKALRYSLEAGEKSKVVYANDEAIEFFSRAIENCNESADLMIEKAARCHEERASVYSFIGRGEDAIKDTQESLNLAVESKDKSLLAFCLSEACIVYELSSKFDKMKESAEKALEIYIELSDKFGIAKAYNYIGMYYGIAGEPKREMEILLKAAEILKGAREEYEKTKKKSVSKGEEVSLLAVILNNLGYVQRLLGDNESALKNYEESLKARKLIEDKTGIAQVLNNIGMIYGRGGDIPRAMPYCEESIKIYDEIGNKKGLGSSLINYGYFNGEIGNHQKELECYEKSLQIQKQINDKYVMSFTLGNIGNYHLKMNNPKKALECQLESLALKKEINDRTGMAATYSNIARCYKAMGDDEKRIENLKEELKIYEEAGEEKKAAELKEKIK